MHDQPHSNRVTVPAAPMPAEMNASVTDNICGMNSRSGKLSTSMLARLFGSPNCVCCTWPSESKFSNSMMPKPASEGVSYTFNALIVHCTHTSVAGASAVPQGFGTNCVVCVPGRASTQPGEKILSTVIASVLSVTLKSACSGRGFNQRGGERCHRKSDYRADFHTARDINHEDIKLYILI